MFRVGHAGAAKWAARVVRRTQPIPCGGWRHRLWASSLISMYSSSVDQTETTRHKRAMMTDTHGRCGVRHMTQSALRIISIFLICAAATPVGAGPRGGGHFGGGVHFSAGTGCIAAPHIASPELAAPHFAPLHTAPRFSSPLMVSHSARNTRIPLTTALAPQPFARPAHLPQSHMIVGRIGSVPLLGSVRQIPPTSRAANAFALSGVHRP